jgi:hypothetical protein
MRMVKLGILEILLSMALPSAFAQATLPTSYSGPWQTGTPPAGWTFSGLGGPDYNPDYDGLNNGAAKLDGTGDFILISFDAPAGNLSFWIRGLSFSGGTFSVEESSDGAAWSSLQTYAPPPTNASYQTLIPSPDSRQIRFIYSVKGTGNVGIDGISIAPFIQPVISDIAVDGIADVTVQETLSGRTYVLESASALDADPVQWIQADSDAGTGGSLDLQDSASTNVIRFYRVRDTTP